MSVTLRVCLIVASVFMAIYTFRKIRKNQLNIDDSIYWIVTSVCLVVLSAFPIIPTKIAELLGIESPVNLVYLVVIFFIILKLFLLVIDFSVQKHRLNMLVEKLAVIDKENKDKIEDLIKENDLKYTKK